NYRGEPVNTGDVLADFLAGNMPITMQPLVRGWSKTSSNNPVSALEQFYGSLGFHVSRYSPTTRIYPLVDKWLGTNGSAYGLTKQQGVYPISKYQQMKYALDDGDFDRASVEYQKLQKTGTPEQKLKLPEGFHESLSRPFTGSERAEKAFETSLSPDDKKIYNAAVERQKLL